MDDGVELALRASALAGMALQIATINRLHRAGALSADDVREIFDETLLQLETQRGATETERDQIAYDLARALVAQALPRLKRQSP